MDAMARALLNAADIMENSPIPEMLHTRYASFDSGAGKEFEEGKLNLEALVAYAKEHDEPRQISGKKELYETIVALYAKKREGCVVQPSVRKDFHPWRDACPPHEFFIS